LVTGEPRLACFGSVGSLTKIKYCQSSTREGINMRFFLAPMFLLLAATPAAAQAGAAPLVGIGIPAIGVVAGAIVAVAIVSLSRSHSGK
jgi:hypothetical protein